VPMTAGMPQEGHGSAQPSQGSAQHFVQPTAQASASSSASAHGTAPWHGTDSAMADSGPTGVPMPRKLTTPMPGTNWTGAKRGSAEAMAMGPSHTGYGDTVGTSSFLGLGHWTAAEPNAEVLHKALGDAQQHLGALARGLQISLEHKDSTCVTNVCGCV